MGRARQGGQGRHLPAIFSTNRARQGQGKAAEADTHPLFSVTLAFIDRPNDERVQIITIFTNCH